MRLKIGAYTRYNNEAVASITYTPIYDALRQIVKIRERWDITGRIVNDPATFEHANAELQKLFRDFSQLTPDLVFLDDDTAQETAMYLRASDCLVGPYLIDSSLPNQANDVYVTGLPYRVVYEAERLANVPGNPILAFNETLSADPGGEVAVYVGGAVNLAERQTGWQQMVYTYIQRGSAVGWFNYPEIPGPIWPFAQMKAPRVEMQSAKVLGQIDTEYEIAWEYVFQWHLPLSGRPHRRVR